MSAVAETKGLHSLLEEDHPYSFIDSSTQPWPEAGHVSAHRLLQPDLQRALEASEEAVRAFASVRDTIEMLAAQLDEGDLRMTFSPRTLVEIASARQMPRCREAGEALDGLTRREREVAVLVATGMTNRMIAAELQIGVRTVETHVSNILSKLGFTSRSQIVAWALDHDLQAVNDMG